MIRSDPSRPSSYCLSSARKLYDLGTGPSLHRPGFVVRHVQTKVEGGRVLRSFALPVGVCVCVCVPEIHIQYAHM